MLIYTPFNPASRTESPMPFSGGQRLPEGSRNGRPGSSGRGGDKQVFSSLSCPSSPVSGGDDDRPTDLLFNVNSALRSRALESVPGSSNGDRSFVHFGSRCAEHAPLRRYEGAYKRERKARLVVLVSRVYGYGRKRARSRFCVGPELGSWPALVGSAVSRRILVQCTRCVSK